MKMQMTIAVYALFFAAFLAAADERRTYPCHRLAQAPSMDGKINDSVWKNLPEATGFYVLSQPGQCAVEKQTYFKAGWTDDAIYFAIRAEETTPQKMTGSSGFATHMEDSVEIFLFPSGAQAYTQLIANSAGGRKGGKGWTVKTSVDPAGWGLETRIPFPDLGGGSPKVGDKWPANVARNMLSEPLSERATCWPLLEKGFHDVKNFGWFVFHGPSGGDVANEEREINKAYLMSMRGDLKKLSRLAGKYVVELGEAKKSGKAGAGADDLLQKWRNASKLAGQSAPDYHETLRTSRACAGLRLKSEECIARATMEALFGR
ncbi:MAG: sugar-binding protein [Verrucomicrobiae bacterium]|nr:sugar-binding protein [Verrucomicrobiae bacterium]